MATKGKGANQGTNPVAGSIGKVKKASMHATDPGVSDEPGVKRVNQSQGKRQMSQRREPGPEMSPQYGKGQRDYTDQESDEWVDVEKYQRRDSTDQDIKPWKEHSTGSDAKPWNEHSTGSDMKPWQNTTEDELTDAPVPR